MKIKSHSLKYQFGKTYNFYRNLKAAGEENAKVESRFSNVFYDEET